VARITKSAPERRQEIIDTARALFIKDGFDKTQVSDISKKLNVAQGLVYHYFKSKTEILYAVIDELAEEQRRAVEAILNSSKGSAFERLGVLFDSHPDLDAFDKLIPSIANDSAIVDYCSDKMVVSSMPLLLSLIEQGNADGSWNCEYPKETAAFILQGFRGFVENFSHPAAEESSRQALVSIVSRILSYSQK
jgi:AcrR family transcriptional regulator